MSVRTHQPPEVFTDLPINSRKGSYMPEPTEWPFFIGKHVVPRMFKAANGGAASRDGHGWPYDMSSGVTMGHLPHPPIILTIPDKRSGLTVGGDANRSHSSQRIPPVLVRTTHL